MSELMLFSRDVVVVASVASDAEREAPRFVASVWIALSSEVTVERRAMVSWFDSVAVLSVEESSRREMGAASDGESKIKSLSELMRSSPSCTWCEGC